MLSRRLAVVLTVGATLAAGIPALLTTTAQAAATGDIRLVGPTRGAAGSCLSYTVTPTDAFGSAATDTGTVVVRLTESPNDSSQDVDLCRPGTVSTPTVAPHYVNGNGARQTYTAGTGVTSTPTAAAGTTPASNPDVASTTTPAAQANPAGTDTAVYVYDGRTGGNTTITFGVVALTSGGATLDVFRSADGDETKSPGDLSKTQSITFSAGGLPGSPQAADAVTTVVVTPEQSFSPSGGAAHSFSVQLTNSAGDGVTGVTPRIAATAGPNAPTGAVPAGTFTASCGVTDNSGKATCTYSGTRSGTDTVTVWVNQTAARTPSPGPGLDPNEPRDTAAATSTVGTGQAKTITLAPKTSSTVSGTSRQLTATVADVNGTPAAGVPITFTESGPGSIQGGTAGNGGTSTLNATTGSNGTATVTLLTAAADRGSNTVTAAIRTPANTQCQTSGGRCTDTATVSIAAASPSPAPSPTAPACTTATTLLGQPLINAMDTANVTVTARAGSTVDLFAYTRPSTTFTIVRTGVVPGNGAITWQVRPPRNTRLYAQQRTGCPAGNQVVLGVRTTLSLAAVRNGPRNYTFFGDSLPARPGGLIVSLYRITSSGSEVLTAQARASATTGEWTLTRQFTGSGTFGFILRTGQDLQNAPGASHVRPTAVF
jgi:hypothetical protein